MEMKNKWKQTNENYNSGYHIIYLALKAGFCIICVLLYPTDVNQN